MKKSTARLSKEKLVPVNDCTPADLSACAPQALETPEAPEPSGGPDSTNWTTSCMTFNVLKDRNPGTNYADPEVRAPWILDTIAKYEPDLLGMQELCKTCRTGWDMYTYLKTELSKKGYDMSGLMDAAGKEGSNVAVMDYTIGSGLAIMWKRDRFEMKDFGAMAYSGDASRHYQWIKLYDKKENITILMTNTHMSINPRIYDTHEENLIAGRKLRAEEATELYNFWQKNCKDDMALYATGDYNFYTSNDAFANLIQGKFIYTRDISTIVNAGPRIDHILINGDIQDCYEYHRCEETYEPAGIEKGDPENRNQEWCASDHQAVIVYCSNINR